MEHNTVTMVYKGYTIKQDFLGWLAYNQKLKVGYRAHSLEYIYYQINNNHSPLIY